MGSTCGTCLDCRGRIKGSRCRGQRVWDLEEIQDDGIIVFSYLAERSRNREGKARALNT